MVENKEQLLFFILNHSQECIIKYDSHGCIDYCNDRLLELTGYSAGELIGAYIGELIQNVFEIVDNHSVRQSAKIRCFAGGADTREILPAAPPAFPSKIRL